MISAASDISSSKPVSVRHHGLVFSSILCVCTQLSDRVRDFSDTDVGCSLGPIPARVGTRSTTPWRVPLGRSATAGSHWNFARRTRINEAEDAVPGKLRLYHSRTSKRAVRGIQTCPWQKASTNSSPECRRRPGSDRTNLKSTATVDRAQEAQVLDVSAGFIGVTYEAHEHRFLSEVLGIIARLHCRVQLRTHASDIKESRSPSASREHQEFWKKVELPNADDVCVCIKAKAFMPKKTLTKRRDSKKGQARLTTCDECLRRPHDQMGHVVETCGLCGESPRSKLGPREAGGTHRSRAEVLNVVSLLMPE